LHLLAFSSGNLRTVDRPRWIERAETAGRRDLVNDEERYLFDLRGYLVLRGVLSAAEVDELNRLVDEQRLPAPGEDIPSQRFVGFLDWGQPFRDLLDHPRILPVLTEVIDPAVRLDHYYGIHMRSGTSGLSLHGGGTPYDRSEYFHFRNGRMYNGLTVVSWMLTDCPEGQGGFAAVPGSHKSNYPCPKDIKTYTSASDCVVQVPAHAGDVLIFTEALTHGTHRWTAPHDRRSLLYKYGPGHLARAQSYAKWSGGLLEQLSPQQRRLLEPPYAHDRKRVVEAVAEGHG
jgi:hypothetical protein